MVRIFSGTETLVNLLKIILDDNQIPSVVKNNFQSGLIAGFGTNTEYAIELYIQEKDSQEAQPIVEKFIEINS